MKAVWKTNLTDCGPDLGRGMLVKLPVGAQVIAAQYQRGELCVWSIVDTEAEMEDRRIYVVGTGRPVPDGVSYVDTIQDHREVFVWHMFA